MSETRGEKETSRVEAFSDGEDAIAITLLILEIKVPHLLRGADSIRRAYALALAIYLVATVVALFSAFAGLALSSLLWVLWARLNYGPAEEAGNIPTRARSSRHGASKET